MILKPATKRFDAESMRASATTTMSPRSWRPWNCLTIGMIVFVSARSPSKQPISNGNPPRSTSRPITSCGSTGVP